MLYVLLLLFFSAVNWETKKKENEKENNNSYEKSANPRAIPYTKTLFINR